MRFDPDDNKDRLSHKTMKSDQTTMTQKKKKQPDFDPREREQLQKLSLKPTHSSTFQTSSNARLSHAKSLLLFLDRPYGFLTTLYPRFESSIPC